jgi:hypothetical protein
MLTSIGLSIIIVAWLFQLIVSLRKKNKLSFSFVILYSVGVLLLVIGAFNSGMTTLATINLVSLLASLSVLITIIIKK